MMPGSTAKTRPTKLTAHRRPAPRGPSGATTAAEPRRSDAMAGLGAATAQTKRTAPQVKSENVCKLNVLFPPKLLAGVLKKNQKNH